VRIALQQVAGGYTISVSDSGPGIPPSMQPHIFDRFYRSTVRTPRAHADDGAGLGLALARWIARTHGGELSLASSSEAGTTFTAFLPSPTDQRPTV
jgi:signal transduction histidine kinase